MESLNFVIDADCSPAIGALRSTEDALDSLAGKRASVGIETNGASGAIRELQAIRTASRDASGDVRVGADTSGIQQARADLGGLRGDFRSAANEMDSLAGERAIGFSNTSSIEGLSRNLTSAGQSMGAFGSEAERAETSMGRVSSSSTSASESIRSVGTRASESEGAMSSLGSTSERSMSGISSGAREMDRSFAGAANSVGQLEGNMQRVGNLQTLNRPMNAIPGGPLGSTRPSVSELESIVGENSGVFGSEGSGYMRSDGGAPPPRPPRDPPSGGGGGGGGGRGGGRGPRMPSEEGGDADDGLDVPRRAGREALIGGVVGIAESLMAGAAGMMAANEVIKATPDLALAANNAMGQFSKGVREAGSAAIGEAVPELHQLGGVLHGLGSEVGAVGVEHMGETLAAASSLAGTATTALQRLDPAIGSSIAGLQGVGNALMEGISSPTSVQGIRSVGEALANASNDTGLKNLTSGLGTLAPIAGKVIADVAGDVGNLPGMGNADIGPSLQGGLSAGMMTKSPLIGGLAALATYQAQQEEAAGRQDMVTPGILGGVGGAMGANKLGSGMGLKGGRLGAATLGGYLAGDLIGAGGAMADKSLGTGSLLQDIGQGAVMGAGIGAYGGPWGAAGGALIGAGLGFAKNALSGPSDTDTTGPTTDSSGFPTGTAAPYGWNRDESGALTPSRGPNDTGTGTYSAPKSSPSASQSRFPGQIGSPRPTPPPAPPKAPPVTPGPPLKNDGAKSLGDSIQRLGPEVQKAIPPAQNLGSQYKQSADQVKRLPEAVKPTMAALQTIPEQMNTAMASASRNVDSGGEAIGSQVPKSMAQGVSKNTNQACNAAADMGNSTVKCAKSALDSASPSKKFVELGEGIGQGLAIGVNSSSGAAAASVGASMAKVVAAGQAGLQAASPSRAFAAMGGQMMQQAARSMNAATNAQGAMATGGRLAQPGQQQEAARAQQQLAAARSETQNAKSQTAEQKALAAAHEQMMHGNAMHYTGRADDNIVNHNREAERRLNIVKQNHDDAKEAARQGISPSELRQNRQNQDLNSGPAMPRVNNNQMMQHFQQMSVQGMSHNNAISQANQGGSSLVTAMTAGMNSRQGQATAAGAAAADAASGGTKKKAKVNSPSVVMADIGRNMVDGLVVGLMAGGNSAGAAAAGLASVVTTQIDANGMSGFAATGLKLGFVMGENLVTGMQTVLQKNQLMSLATPQGLSQQAMVGLAGTGLGAPAGSGASISNNPQAMVAFSGAGSAANPLSAPAAPATPAPTEQTFHLYLDGKPFQVIAQTEVREALQQLIDTLPRQRG